MDFSLTEEQTMLADSIARFIDNDYEFETRQELAASDLGYSVDFWQTFAELGWTAMPFSEADGGLGGGPVELMLLMEQFGRGLIVEPYLATIILGGGVLRRAASGQQKELWLPRMIEGNLQVTLAYSEPQARFDIGNIATTAAENSGKFVINGHKNVVPNGGNAELVIVPARTAGSQTDEDGITLFAVPADSPGMHRKAYATVDGHRAADLSLEDVHVDEASIVGEVGGGFTTLRSVVDEATLAVCAEAVGILRTMHAKTVEYSKNRVQFGVPIGSFQALQHRMVDCLMACEHTHSLLLWATMLNAAGDVQACKSISALKYQIGTAGRQVAQEAVQIHGGMGVTWELDIAHYFKRFTVIELLFGSADFHLDRYLRLS